MRSPVLGVIGLGLAVAVPASAATLTTPYLYQGGGQNVCIAINVGRLPIEVTVEAVPLDLSPEEYRTETCTLQPLTGTAVPSDGSGTCETFMNTAGFCRFTARGGVAALRTRLRAVMMNRSTSSPFTISTSAAAQ
jgi:hypothetical protein